MKLDLYLPSYTKINSKWVRVKIIKLLEKTIGVNLYDFGVGSGFLGMTPKKAQATKE